MAAVARDPASWAGREVRLVGLVVDEFEHSAIYPSRDDYCASRHGLQTDWSDAGLVSRQDTRRMAVVSARVVAPGEATMNPGDQLTHARVTGWLSEQLPRCRAAKDASP